MANPKVKVGVSARHVHLTQEHLEILFGAGTELEPLRETSFKGVFAAKQQVAVKTEKGELAKVRILGPCRKQTQVEVSKTDGFKLKVDIPVRMSGKLAGSPGCTLVGPAGEVELEEGLIVAARHIHLSVDTLAEWGKENGDIVDVKFGGDRGVTFHNVILRGGGKPGVQIPSELHLDTDEANAACIPQYGEIEVLL